MSIRDASEVNRERQEKRADERHSKEAEARPDPMHRAVLFLLQQAILLNRDVKREAEHHIATLDNELGVPEAIDEVDQLPDDDPTRTAAENTQDPEQPAAGTRTAATDTATALRTSRRFQRGGE